MASTRTRTGRRRSAGPKYQRVRKTATDYRAGCYDCQGGEAHWWGKNAQGVAARHTDATGHKTWVEASLMICYTTPEREAADKAADR